MRILLLLLCALLAIPSSAQFQVTVNRQHAFPRSIPAGDYSGIAWMGGNRYAVVSDKEKEGGFYIWEINVDTLSGEIRSARNLGFHSAGHPGRDEEDIIYIPQTNRLWIVGEADNRILEYDTNGNRTSRELKLPVKFRHLPANQGLEALTYNPHTNTIWTCNESDSILIQSYDSLYRPAQAFAYRLDAPRGKARKSLHYAHGIGTLCALDDGSLLVLEREFRVPRAKIGASVRCKLYRFVPGEHRKTLMAQWKTSLTLLKRNLANYEGSCLGPRLADGSRVMILVADSQHQYAGVLKDRLRTLKLKTE